MSDVTKTVANAAIDLADNTTANVIDVLGTAADLAEGVAEAPIHIAGKTVKAVLDEAADLQKRSLALLRQVADAVTEPLP